MIPIALVYWSAVALAVASGAAATFLAAQKPASAGRLRVAEKMAQIAFVLASGVALLLTAA